MPRSRRVAPSRTVPRLCWLLLAGSVLCLAGWWLITCTAPATRAPLSPTPGPSSTPHVLPSPSRTSTVVWSIPIASPVIRRVVEDALAQTQYTVGYDPSYVKLAYPGGDVPLETGVCTDVIVRAFRKGGVDLQKEIHEDMTRNFSAYPQLWRMTRPDANIDHRRVQNQMTFFQRKGAALSLSNRPADYAPGDVVAWDLGSISHVGIVTNIRDGASENLQIVHNIGAGARLADVLFAWRIIGHYRYFR